uniref:Uncharacterized protein n=1 Tax=Cajanus cajan TaxID=3821 RepID=A0A151RSK0_CAJCA|nr:hypothetical protein KK1_032927 [Cajanus cajan]
MKADVRMDVKHYSMYAHQTFVVVESELKVLSRCLNNNEGGRHTCMNAILSQDHNKLDSEFICFCILGMVKEDVSMSILLIQERISGQFNYKVLYRKTWKAKQKVISRVFGDWEDSYDLLPRWLDRMLECCPGSTYRLKTIDYMSNNVVAA